jgi:hypothetical protein
MKTYSETKKKPKFNWYKFLDRAAKGKLVGSELADAQDDVESWVTCAVGNQCSIIPRNEESGGEPVDDRLYGLGCDFCESIKNEEWNTAKKIVDKIEKRSALLINKELDKMIKTIKEYGYKVMKA